MTASEPVRAWEETVVIPTYPVPPPDKNPMFLEKRVYQGSSGKVYPCAFTDRVSDGKVDRPYRAVFLENEYIRLMLLPEIGGRIHIGFDKTNGYDFFYRQNVIKPALVGLLGPWISGGVEFNWPQHHRPTTFMPVEYAIEEHADGSRTVWLSEHEPMNRMKGMVGICLHPGKSLVEAKVRLYNRTSFTQTFLWWANAAVHVHGEYQAFFPPDVTFVADHAKRAVIDFPIAHGFYYGVNYHGVDLRWYRNIPVPTSYMVTASNYDFFGGYDHRKKAGLVHYADRHISPGKKMWTWGNHEFGYAWDRELTDADGPYIELMAGVFTDNQPDFSWLQPYETKTFRQYWYPIQEIGPAKNANRAAAVNLEIEGGTARIGVCATERFEGATVALESGGRMLFEARADFVPGRPFLTTVEGAEADSTLRVVTASGCELIRYRPEILGQREAGQPATEPPPPRKRASLESLYLTGVHLEQYRHATRDPEVYWGEVLAREPGDVRANDALGLAKLRRGLFGEAEQHFRAAIETLTLLNPNPSDGQSHYNLGVALQYQGRLDEAYAEFAKAAWNYGCRSSACYALAQIASLRGDFEGAIERLDESLSTSARHTKARDLKAALLLRLGRDAAAHVLAEETLAMDPLDPWARSIAAPECAPSIPPQTRLDVAFDYAAAGLWPEAVAVVGAADCPALLYPLAWFLHQAGDLESAAEASARAAQASPDYYFPSRLEELLVLQRAGDARAAYHLGNLFYDKRRYQEAIGCWRRAAEAEPKFATAWRNLGIASYNVLRQPEEALRCYSMAFAANQDDARVLYEYDQLRKRTGAAPSGRLELLERFGNLVQQRDDLTIELVALYNQTGQAQRALDALLHRRLHPWEGGEGKASGQYVAARLILGRAHLEAGDAVGALEHFQAARAYPPNLGEGKHLLTPEHHIHYFRGLALEQLGRHAEGCAAFKAASDENTNAPAMAYYQAMALRRLGDDLEARRRLEQLRRSIQQRMAIEPKIDYFATSLPNFLIFEDDLEKRNRVECEYLTGLAKELDQPAEAAEHFSAALALDPNHLEAAQELAALQKGERHAGI